MSTSLVAMAPEDLRVLRWATRHLEHPSLAARLSSLLGTPIEMAVKLLPRSVYRQVQDTATRAISRAVDVSISSLQKQRRPTRSIHRSYNAMVGGSGAVGGLFGVYGLLLELPVSTILMLRAIAEIARSEGEDLDDPATRLACLEVFALGGPADSDDAAETGYYGIRLALALQVTSAAHHLARFGMGGETAPLLARLISGIGSRFGLAVSQKTAAQMMPLIGAVGGATINIIFMNHFQEMARGHFVVRRLERKYGEGLVRSAYENLRQGR